MKRGWERHRGFLAQKSFDIFPKINKVHLYYLSDTKNILQEIYLWKL